MYCHNSVFQNIDTPESIKFTQVLEFLSNRVGLLEGVVFSGGEPLLQFDLYESMKQVKDMGFLIGLHTSGIIYENFMRILPIVDWIGFDIKTSFKSYKTITQIQNSERAVIKSFEALVQSNNAYEIRTTVDSRYITQEDLVDIAQLLSEKGIGEWVLQECVLRAGKDIHLPFPDDKEIAELSQYIKIKVRR